MADESDERRADSDLRAALLRGEREAADALVEAHGDAVFEFVLLRVGRDRALAEDLTQETLLEALGAIERFEGRSSLRTWLMGIARNKLRSSRRGRSARLFGDILIAADDEVLASLGRLETELLPDDVIAARETELFVHATLASLPDSYRSALRERYVDGRTVPETARRAGCNVKAAESTLHRAKRAFKDAFTAVVRSAAREGKAPMGGQP